MFLDLLRIWPTLLLFVLLKTAAGFNRAFFESQVQTWSSTWPWPCHNRPLFPQRDIETLCQFFLQGTCIAILTSWRHPSCTCPPLSWSAQSTRSSSCHSQILVGFESREVYLPSMSRSYTDYANVAIKIDQMNQITTHREHEAIPLVTLTPDVSIMQSWIVILMNSHSSTQWIIISLLQKEEIEDK